MTNLEIIKKVEALKDLENLIEEAKAEAEALKDEIKAEMARQQTEEMIIGRFIVRWTSVCSDKFDSKTFKAVMPEVYNQYIKQTHSRRFSIN